VATTRGVRLSKPNSPSSTLAALGLPAGPGSIYELAITHRSFAFERPTPIPHNERLEFLGDAILGALVTDLCYRSFPDLTEGQMARLRASVVSTQALAQLAREIGLGAHIRLGRGERASGGHDKSSLLADTFEALVGATYLDRGMEHLAAVLVPIFAARLLQVAAAGGGYDAKTALQEAVVRLEGERPAYRLASTGPDHAKVFTASVYVNEELHGTGSGRSKKEAEQNAAAQALMRLGPAGALRSERDARAS
jgi:ribonuclease III